MKHGRSWRFTTGIDPVGIYACTRLFSLICVLSGETARDLLHQLWTKFQLAVGGCGDCLRSVIHGRPNPRRDHNIRPEVTIALP
jgi:hypothetical protein